MKPQQILFIFLFPLLFSSCLMEDSYTLVLPPKKTTVDENGLTPAINDFVSDDIMDDIMAMGMPINGGANPPAVSGTFFISPVYLLDSNIATDYVGMQFYDITLTFYEQDNTNLTVRVSEFTIDSNAEGMAGFIVGEGDDFTVVGQMETYSQGYAADYAMIISGTMGSYGIEDLHYALFMIDNHGNQGGIYIENGQGRVAYDGDFFSERSSVKSGTSPELAEENSNKISLSPLK